jgi:hypothetical protein
MQPAWFTIKPIDLWHLPNRRPLQSLLPSGSQLASLFAPGKSGAPVVWICAFAESATTMTVAANIPQTRMCLFGFIGFRTGFI